MKKKINAKNITIVAGIIVILGIAGLIFLVKPEFRGSVSGDKENFVTASISANQVLSGVFTIGGAVKGGYFFEANARGMLLDEDQKVLKTFPISATSDWMTNGPVGFTATVDTTDIPKGPGYFRIAKDNPKGDASGDAHIDIPVIFK